MRIARSKGCVRLGASLPETETDPVSESSCLLKELDDGQSSKKQGRMHQLTLVILSSLFCLHMII